MKRTNHHRGYGPPPYVPPGDCSLFFGGAFGAEPAAGANRLLAPSLPTIVGFTSFIDAGGTTAHLNMPVGTAVGDMLLFQLSSWDLSVVWSLPAGRGLTTIQNNPALFINAHLAWKIATEDDFDSSPQEFAFSHNQGSSSFACACLAITNVDGTGSPEEALNTNGPLGFGEEANPPCPSITTTRRRTLVLAMCTIDMGNRSWTAPADMELVYNIQSGSLSKSAIVCASMIQPVVGSTGIKRFGMANTDAYNSWQIAIASADSG